MERADRLSEPPVIGRFYLVPAIRWTWNALFGESILDGRGAQWWPVIGPKHNDSAFFQFEHLHYHVDVRFLGARHWSQVSGYYGFWKPEASLDEVKLRNVISRPLSSIELKDGPPAPILRKMRCTRAVVPYPCQSMIQVTELNTHYVGQQCVRSKRGWVCPHQHVPLGSITPINGVITCFLHGLRIDAKTGICLGDKSGPKEAT